MSKIETIILNNLLYNDKFRRKVIPFLKEEFFHDKSEAALFKIIIAHFNKYNVAPSPKEIGIELDLIETFSQQEYIDCQEKLKKELSKKSEDQGDEWLFNKTETFCKEKAIYNAIMKSISIIDGRDKKNTEHAIPQILQDALSISFDDSIGHDYILDVKDRYDLYHTKEDKLPFDIEYLNKITNGGISKKTLTIWMAGTAGGKSLVMCHAAAAHLSMGYNVLYITLEMSEEKIAERIDANIFDLPINVLDSTDWQVFKTKINKLKEKTSGKLIIKEYPTSTANISNFKHLLYELKSKKNFIPDIIYIDYMNICSSARLQNNMSNSYMYVKSISEELRSLAVEYNVPIVTATQVNRQGYNDSDFGLENTSESFGVTHVSDLFLGIISSEELESLGQIMIKQLKNRYNDLNSPRRFNIGINKSKMKLYNLEESAQKNIINEPIIDNSLNNKHHKKKNFEGLVI